MSDDYSAKYAVSITGLDEILAKIPNEVRRRESATRMITKIALAVRAEAMHRIPKRTGNTARNIEHRVNPATLVGQVGVFPDHEKVSKVAMYLETGTGLYGPKHSLIYPKTKKVMAWPVGSGGVSLTLSGQHRARDKNKAFAYARSTKGMHPQPWLWPSWVATEPLRSKVIQEEAAHIFGKPE